MIYLKSSQGMDLARSGQALKGSLPASIFISQTTGLWSCQTFRGRQEMISHRAERMLATFFEGILFLYKAPALDFAAIWQLR